MATHFCPWPGCTERVAASRYACKPHWFRLPAEHRAAISVAYGKFSSLSSEHVKAMTAAEHWMRDNGNGMFHCSFVASKGPTVASTTGWAEASGKRHFFVERTSLCRRFWLFDDTTVLDQSGDEHPDNCTGCQRRALTRNASQAQGGMA